MSILKNRNTRLALVVFALIAVIAVCVPVAVVLYKNSASPDDRMHDESPVVNGDFAIKMSLDETWIPAYGNKNSPQRKAMAEDIERNMQLAFNESDLQNIVNSVTVVHLSEGSVKADTEVKVNRMSRTITDQGNNNVTVNLESYDVADAFKKGVKKVVSKISSSILAKVNLMSVNVTKTSEKRDAVTEECVSKMDVVFLMDKSGSIGPIDFITMKNFVSEFASKSKINRNAIQMSVITFATWPKSEFPLNMYQSAGSVVPAINNIYYSGGGTDIADGLTYVMQSAYTEANGRRSDASKLLILMTDGQSADASAEARQLKDSGVQIICIGIGAGVDMDQLNKIASESSLVFQASSFDTLSRIQNITLKASCESRNYTCFGDIMRLNATGHKNGEIAQSETDVKRDKNEIMNRRSCYVKAGRENCIQPPLIAAIASRESRAGRLLYGKNGTGDGGKAYGIMQCDINANPVATYNKTLNCTSYPWNSCEHIEMMTKYVLVPFIKAVKRKHTNWTNDQTLQGGVAAYNFGVGNVCTWASLDVGTTGGDYSNDIIARAKYLTAAYTEELLNKTGEA